MSPTPTPAPWTKAPTPDECFARAATVLDSTTADAIDRAQAWMELAGRLIALNAGQTK